MSVPITENKIVVITGAGISAESGLQTFRDSSGLWNNYSLDDVATPEAWQRNPQLVLDFYNKRRQEVVNACPNNAHLCIASLEKLYEVVVITQNVDDLHERAGSTNVIHVHGEIIKARSTIDEDLIYSIGGKDINIGDVCERGSQLRPNIVWFGEDVENLEIAQKHINTASKVLVIGTSLSVYPAAGLVKKARHHAEKLIVQPALDKKPYGYFWFRGTAVDIVPNIVNRWLDGKNVTEKGG